MSDKKLVIVTVLLCLWTTSVFSQSEGIRKDRPTLYASGYKEIPIEQETQVSDTIKLTRYRYISKGGMSKKHQKIFNTVHGEKQTIEFAEARKLNKIIYDTLNNLYYGQLSNSNTLSPGATVVGWHPYWMTEACRYYPFSLLSTIAFFAYDVNEEDGSPYDKDAITNWRSTPLIDSAKKFNVKTLLTITSYGEHRNNVLLENKNTSWTALGDSLCSLLRERGAQGIDIDFTGIIPDRREQYVKFVNSLRTKIGDTCIITLHITAKDLNNGGLDLRSLKYKAKVNTFIVQGYDYQNNVRKEGALAPLYSKDKDCIVQVVEKCFKEGLEPKDMILMLPLFGTISGKKEYGEISYNDIVTLYENNYARTIDPWSESTKIVLGGGDTTIWYESGENIYRKFHWAAEHDLQGVGLWGLGYEGGLPEVWKAVAENYGVQSVKEIFPVSVENGKIYSFSYKLQQYRKVIGTGLFIITFFFVTGLLLSLLDWRVREIFFRSYLNRALLSSVVMILFIVALYSFSAGTLTSDNSLLALVIGLIVGGIVVYLTTRFYMTYRKKMP